MDVHCQILFILLALLVLLAVPSVQSLTTSPLLVASKSRPRSRSSSQSSRLHLYDTSDIITDVVIRKSSDSLLIQIPTAIHNNHPLDGIQRINIIEQGLVFAIVTFVIVAIILSGIREKIVSSQQHGENDESSINNINKSSSEADDEKNHGTTSLSAIFIVCTIISFCEVYSVTSFLNTEETFEVQATKTNNQQHSWRLDRTVQLSQPKSLRLRERHWEGTNLNNVIRTSDSDGNSNIFFGETNDLFLYRTFGEHISREEQNQIVEAINNFLDNDECHN